MLRGPGSTPWHLQRFSKCSCSNYTWLSKSSLIKNKIEVSLILLSLYKYTKPNNCKYVLVFHYFVLSPPSPHQLTYMTVFSTSILSFFIPKPLASFQTKKLITKKKVVLLSWHSLIDNEVCQRSFGIQWWLRSDSVFEAALFVSGNLFCLEKWPFRIQHGHVITAGAKHWREPSEVRLISGMICMGRKIKQCFLLQLLNKDNVILDSMTFCLQVDFMQNEFK